MIILIFSPSPPCPPKARHTILEHVDASDLPIPSDMPRPPFLGDFTLVISFPVPFSIDMKMFDLQHSLFRVIVTSHIGPTFIAIERTVVVINEGVLEFVTPLLSDLGVTGSVEAPPRNPNAENPQMRYSHLWGTGTHPSRKEDPPG